MTHPTDEELDAPIAMKAGDPRVIVKGRPLPVDFRIIAEDEYQKLRAQLAEVQADLTFMTESRNKWQDSATQRWFRLEEANARADRAEAERAAQIEVDADICRGAYDSPAEYDALDCATLIRNQPHDRTALDRMLADAEANALLRAAECDGGCMEGHECPNGPHGVCCGNYGIDATAILALIPKEGA